MRVFAEGGVIPGRGDTPGGIGEDPSGTGTGLGGVEGGPRRDGGGPGGLGGGPGGVGRGPGGIGGGPGEVGGVPSGVSTSPVGGTVKPPKGIYAKFSKHLLKENIYANIKISSNIQYMSRECIFMTCFSRLRKMVLLQDMLAQVEDSLVPLEAQEE